MKVFTVVGARPQFIKAAPVSKALKKAGQDEFIVHTGQHYDHHMSQVFFDEMSIPMPDVNLGVGSGNHGWQTGQMLVRIEELLLAEKPNYVLVYGDTNSTLAGALAAVKVHIPIAHVEAGLRSYNRNMPEEHNRVLTDHCSDLLFCPTQTAVDNLTQEGINEGVRLVGDTMHDAVLQFSGFAQQKSAVLDTFELESKKYILATLHRPSNADKPDKLLNILNAFHEIDEQIIFPVHPRTRKMIAGLGSNFDRVLSKVRLIEPVGYLDMLMLEKHARLIMTDSGGVQKEAYFLHVPCVTLRSETEWVETINAGANILVGTDRKSIVAATKNTFGFRKADAALFGDGRAADKIVEFLDLYDGGL